MTMKTALELFVHRDGDWRDDAACLTSDPELFFPIGTTGSSADQIVKAKSVCASCDVAAQCLEWALTFPASDDHGVLGGLDERQRNKIRRSVA